MQSTAQLSELQRSFVPPSPLTESRPRHVRLTRGGRVLCVVSFLMFVGAIGAFVLLTQESLRQAANRSAMSERGVMTTGVVTRLWEDGDDGRKVVYRFDAEGQSVTGSIKVSAERRRGLEVGAPIAVRFMPDNPKVNDLGGTPRRGLPAAVGSIVALALVAGGALCLLPIRAQRRLLEDGRAAPAIVTGHKTDKSSHGSHHSMTYTFPLPSGGVAAGKSGTSSHPPAIGGVITVVYDPELPTRSRVYPFSLVRPA